MASNHFAQVLVALCALELMGLKRRRKAIWRMHQSWTRASRIEPFERQTATQALPGPFFIACGGGFIDIEEFAIWYSSFCFAEEAFSATSVG